MKTAGYTLIELLVVVAIIAILGGIIVTSLGKSSQSANVSKVFSNFQTKLTVTQANAQANLKCTPNTGPTVSAKAWYGELSKTVDGINQLKVICLGVDGTSYTVDTLSLPADISLKVCTNNLVAGDQSNCQADTLDCSSTLATDKVNIVFSALSGAIEFESSPAQACFPSGKKLFIDFKNSANNEVKTLNVNKGGVIN